MTNEPFTLPDGRTLTDEQKTAIAAMGARCIVAIAEFRGEIPEVVSYIDKSSGFKRWIPKHNIALEFLATGEQVPSELYVERAPEGATDKDGKMIEDQPEPPPPAKIGLKRGSYLLLGIGSYFSKAGKVNCKIKEIIILDTLQPLALDHGQQSEKDGANPVFNLDKSPKKRP